MLVSAWHLFFAAVNLAINDMGTSPLAIAVLVIVFIIGCLLVWFRGGMDALKKHWQQRIGESVIFLLCAWCAVVAYATVQVIYTDHVTARANLSALKTQIYGTNGFQSQIGAQSSEIVSLTSQLNNANLLLKAQSLNAPSPPAQQDDPDTLYQLGQPVATFTGEVVDLPTGTINFQILRFHGDFDPSSEARFRSWNITCHLPIPPAPPGMGNDYTGVIAGGSCTILGLANDQIH